MKLEQYFSNWLFFTCTIQMSTLFDISETVIYCGAWQSESWWQILRKTGCDWRIFLSYMLMEPGNKLLPVTHTSCVSPSKDTDTHRMNPQCTVIDSPEEQKEGWRYEVSATVTWTASEVIFFSLGQNLESLRFLLLSVWRDLHSDGKSNSGTGIKVKFYKERFPLGSCEEKSQVWETQTENYFSTWIYIYFLTWIYIHDTRGL